MTYSSTIMVGSARAPLRRALDHDGSPHDGHVATVELGRERRSAHAQTHQVLLSHPVLCCVSSSSLVAVSLFTGEGRFLAAQVQQEVDVLRERNARRAVVEAARIWSVTCHSESCVSRDAERCCEWARCHRHPRASLKFTTLDGRCARMALQGLGPPVCTVHSAICTRYQYCSTAYRSASGNAGGRTET